MLVFWLIENQEQDDAVKEQRFFHLLELIRYLSTVMMVLRVLGIIQDLRVYIGFVRQ